MTQHVDGIPWRQLPDNCGGQDQVRLRDEIKAVLAQLDRLGHLGPQQDTARSQARDHLAEGLRNACGGQLLNGAIRLTWAWAYQQIAERDSVPARFLSEVALPSARHRARSLPPRLDGDPPPVPVGVSDPNASVHVHNEECEHEHDD